jgi:hypothetical protein
LSRSKRLCGVANAAPFSVGHLYGGWSFPQLHLVKPLILLFLAPYVCSDCRLISPHRRHEEAPCPNVLTDKVPFPLPV